mmetsp:Transcript_36734/g.88285  ORF Transcript_36734/g.88285 Transcript_36734/m.88285 type:complete len:230 (-) Transcript_36734:59-748(-)
MTLANLFLARLEQLVLPLGVTLDGTLDLGSLRGHLGRSRDLRVDCSLSRGVDAEPHCPQRFAVPVFFHVTQLAQQLFLVAHHGDQLDLLDLGLLGEGICSCIGCCNPSLGHFQTFSGMLLLHHSFAADSLRFRNLPLQSPSGALHVSQLLLRGCHLHPPLVLRSLELPFVCTLLILRCLPSRRRFDRFSAVRFAALQMHADGGLQEALEIGSSPSGRATPLEVIFACHG